MKKLFYSLFLVAAFVTVGLAQSQCVDVEEIDGSPKAPCIKQLKVTNGTLSCPTANRCTLTISGGGGGSPGGSNTQLQYNNVGSFGGITGATTNGTVVTLTSPVLVTPDIGTATGTSLTITGAFRTSTANQRIYFGSGSNSFRWSDTVGPYFIDNTATGGLIFNIQSLSSDRTFTWPNASGTVTTIAGTQTLTNKTVTDSTNVLGGVTMTLGSDATGDVYYRNASGILTRVAAGAQNTVFTMGASSVPSWAAASGGGITVGTTTVTSGTTTRVLFNNAGVVGEYTVTGSGNAVLSASPTLTGTVGMAAQTNTGTIVQTSASATAFESGPNGGTNPVFRLVNSTSSQANGVSITGNAAGSAPAITVISSGASEALIIDTKGTSSNGISTNAYDINFDRSSTGSSNFTSLKHRGALFVGGNVTGTNVKTTLFLDGADGSNSPAIRKVTTDSIGFGNGATSATPAAQTLSVQSGSGTNTNGATWTHIGSLGTSQGVPGRLAFQGGALITASGSTAQTAVSRLELGATKVLTNNTVTTVVNVTDASNTVASGFVDYTVEVFDGTDLQYESGSFTYGVTNKGGTIANNTITQAGASGVGVTSNYPVNKTTSGTLTVTWAISAANPALLSVNANSSLTPSTGYPRVTYTIRNLTQQAIAVQ